jgi:hypothetical protein
MGGRYSAPHHSGLRADGKPLAGRNSGLTRHDNAGVPVARNRYGLRFDFCDYHRIGLVPRPRVHAKTTLSLANGRTIIDRMNWPARHDSAGVRRRAELASGVGIFPA